MTSILTIAKKELRTYFTSPIAYVVITVFLVLVAALRGRGRGKGDAGLLPAEGLRPSAQDAAP